MAVLIGILTIAVLLLGVLVAGLLRSHAEILRALHQLGTNLDPDSDTREPVASSARLPTPSSAASMVTARPSAIEGVSPSLEPVVISTMLSDRLTLLVFLTSGCLTCRTFWREMARPDLKVPADARVVIITKGPTMESPSDVAALAPPDHPTVMSGDAWNDFNIPGSPYFVLLGGGAHSHVIGEGTASDWSQVALLMNSALSDAGIVGPDRTAPRAREGRRDVDAGPRVDAEVRRAGIGPGHPSLYPSADQSPVGEEQ